MRLLPAVQVVVSVPLAVLAVIGGGGGPAAAARPRTLAVVPSSLARAVHAAVPVVRGWRLRVGIVLADAHPAALEAYARAASTPGSPLYHRFLSAADVERRFGPSATTVRHDRAALVALGFTDVRRQGAVLYGTASAGTVDAAFGTTLREGVAWGTRIMAPAGPVRVPASLKDVIWLTGMVRTLGAQNDAGAAASARVARAAVVPEALSAASVSTLPATTSLADGYGVDSTVVGPTSVPTGLPVTIRTRITTPSGAADTAASMGAYMVAAGPIEANLGQVEIDGPDNAGDNGSTFTSYTAGTYQISVRVRVGPGLSSQTILLPAVTFTGAPAAEGPLDAAQMTRALDATTVVAAAEAKPASVAVFSTTLPDMRDVNSFTESNGLPPLNVSTVAVDGGPPPGATDGGELSLDLEMIATAAPGATVYVYASPADSPSDTFVDTLNAVASADDVSVVTMSYAESESAGDGHALAQAVAACNAEGITVVSGSGDNGAFGVVGAGASAPGESAEPADIPAVTGVGGVDLRVDNAGEGGLKTAYWGGERYAAMDAAYLARVLARPNGNGNVLGGGGYSADFAAPSYQAALVKAAPGGSAGGRGTPDVAMPASAGYPGMYVILDGQQTVSGGTSMAAPLFAGYVADIAATRGGGFGDLNPDLYAAAAADPSLMTQALYGYDGKWQLTAGAWNPLTGLGTPAIDRLATDLAALSAPAAASVTALNVSVTTAQSLVPSGRLVVTFTATGADASAVAGAALRLTVTGSLTDADLSSTSVVTGSDGRASVVFTAPSDAVSGTIVATAVDGVRAATGLLTVVPARVRSLAFAQATGSVVAGTTSLLALRVDMAPAGAAPGRVPVVVRLEGPLRRTLHTTLTPSGQLSLRLVRTGRYSIEVSLLSAPGVGASRHLRVVPGAAVHFVLHATRQVSPGGMLVGRLFAYDAFGNLDTAARGLVRFEWRVGKRRYAATAAFEDGVSRGALRLAHGVGGDVTAGYAVLSIANAPAS